MKIIISLGRIYEQDKGDINNTNKRCPYQIIHHMWDLPALRSPSYIYSIFLSSKHYHKLLRYLSSLFLLQQMGRMVTRKLLDLNTASIPVDLSKDLSPLKTHEGSFDPNLVVILAALLCALISALAINYIIRWAFHCGQLISGRRRSRSAVEEEEEADGTPAAAPPLVNNKGLKRAAVQTLPTITYAKPSDAALDCPICLADFADGEKVRVLPKCNHSFHRQCIDKWLLDHSSCPTCRQNLVDVLAEKKTVAALLCRYQHSHSCVDSSSIRIIIHHATESQPQHSAAQPQPDPPILIPPRQTDESVENPEQESRV